MIFSKILKRLESRKGKPTKLYLDAEEQEVVKEFLAAYRKAKSQPSPPTPQPEAPKLAEVVSYTGYQMDVLRSVYPQGGHARLHPTYKAFASGNETKPESLLPVFFKFFGREIAPTIEELNQALKDLKDGKREPIITSADGNVSNLGETEDSIILKGMKRLKD